MKNLLRTALALVLALCLLGPAALADETPQPEGGEKFEGNWAKMCGLIEIVYEEEGYRVAVDLFNQDEDAGTLWEYSCYYSEEKDALESISATKTAYTLDRLTLDRALGEPEYQGIDDPEQTTVFTLSPDGALLWQDGRENMGQDLEFRNIGCLEGVWRNDERDVYAEIHWQGLWDEDQYLYDVFLSRGDEEFHLAGLYNAEAGQLECYDTLQAPVSSAEDYFAARDEGTPFDAVFSVLESDQLLLDGIPLAFDLLGPES